MKFSDMDNTIDTLVVGGGQAGIAMSEHLSKMGISHVVYERERIAESWRSCRWDSLKANGPAWHDRFPNRSFQCASDGFASKDEVADYMQAYAEQINAPIQIGVEVTRVHKREGAPGFHIQSSVGDLIARHVVVATGPFQRADIPEFAPQLEEIDQIHSADYRNPKQLKKGGVLVIGAGSSGVQIADELQQSGRKTWLSVGEHDRPPRRYRGRDFCWWLGVLGEWNAIVPVQGKEHVTIAVSGAHGGETIDFRKLAHRGINLVGMTKAFAEHEVIFEDDLVTNINKGDENYRAMLAAADSYIERNGLDLPEEPSAWKQEDEPECLTHPIRTLDLKEQGITTIIWATGYKRDYSWLQVDVFDDTGAPVHQRGVAQEPGIYFLGLPWLSRRGSSFIWGVWHDARYIADQIAIQRSYEGYRSGDSQKRTNV